MHESSIPKLVFTHPFDEREAFEAEARGYLGHVIVELADGARIPVVFYEPVRLGQDLEEEAKFGNPFIAEPGMIVVEAITLDNMEEAVGKLFQEGFFDSFRHAG